MTSNKEVPTTPEAKFSREIDRMIDEKLRRQHFVIPTLSADPPETDPTNLWMRWDGRLRGRYWNGSGYTYVDYPMRSDITSPPAVPAYPSPPASAAAPQTYVATWTASWSQTYRGDETKRTDTIGENNLAFGSDVGGVYGQQRGLFGFDYSSIVTALTGSTIQRVELTFTTIDTENLLGADVYVGMHNHTSEPATYNPTTTILRYGATVRAREGMTDTFALPISYGQQFRAGTAKGLVMEALGPESALGGYAAGVGSAYTPPRLTITYAK
jgi:hypothetical protein